MRSLFILLLSCLPCFAQFGVEQPIFQLASVAAIEDPTEIGNLYRWWVASDVATGQTVSNQLSDRVVGSKLWQMNTTLSPTNSASGIYFSGSTYLTNDMYAGGVGDYDVPTAASSYNTGTLFMVIAPSGAAGEEQLLSLGATDNRGPGMNGTNFRYTGLISGGPNSIFAIAAGATCEVTMVWSNKVLFYYTNSILCSTKTTATYDNFTWGAMGRGALGYYKGYVREVGWYTNQVFGQTDIDKLHKYLTNTYGYSP